MAKSNYEIIKDELKTINGKLDVNNEVTATLRVIVTGNGGKGHEQRIEEMEEWKEKRPQECPVQVKQKNILARRAVDAAVLGVVLGLLMWLLDKF